MTHEIEAVHVARAHAEAGRVRSEEGDIDLRLVSPLQPDADGVTPEQILAAGYAACFLAAVGDSEARSGDAASPVGARVSSTVELGRDADGAYQVTVRIELTGADEGRLQALLESADRTWPYTTGDVRADISVALA